MRGTRRIACGAALCLLLIACAAQAGTTTLVVVRAGDSAVTHWLESDGNAHEVRAVFPVPLFAVGEAIHAWRTVPTEVVLCDCAASAGWNGLGLCPSTGASEPGLSLQLISITTGRLDTPIPPRVLETGEVLSGYRAGIELLGSVGPVVFARIDQQLRSCLDASEHQESRFIAWDLTEGRAAVLYDRKEIAALRSRDQVEAFDLIRDETPVDGFKDLEFTAIRPVHATETLGLRYQFTAPVCATCGDGQWSTGTRSAFVEATSMPRLLAPFAAAPSGLATFRMAHPDAEIVGWSALEGEPGVRDALLQRLQALVR